MWAGAAVVLAFAAVRGEMPWPVEWMGFGGDLRDFYLAAQRYVEARPLYSEPRFVTPPASAAVAALLLDLPFEAAAGLMAVLSVLGVGSAVALVAASTRDRAPGSRRRVILTLAVALPVSYPLFFLADRGNIDGLVMLLLFSGLYLSSRERHTIVAGACLALAAALKVYPILALLPLALRRRWRLVLVTIGWLVVVVVVTSPWEWVEYADSRLLHRTAEFGWEQNISLPCALGWLARAGTRVAAVGGFDGDLVRWVLPATVPVWLLLMLATASTDALLGRRDHTRLSDAEAVALYTPLMVMLPLQVFPYEMVLPLCLLPVLARWWDEQDDHPTRMTLLIAATLLGATQLHVHVLSELLDRSWPHGVSGVALLGLALALATLRLRASLRGGLRGRARECPVREARCALRGVSMVPGGASRRSRRLTASRGRDAARGRVGPRGARRDSAGSAAARTTRDE